MNIIDDYFDNNENHIENIKYIKFNIYVITIDLYKEYLHQAILFRVLEIKNIINNQIESKIIKQEEDYIWLFEENKMCHLDCLTKYKDYYDTYDEAFYENFFVDKQYLLINNGCDLSIDNSMRKNLSETNSFGCSGLYQKYNYTFDNNNYDKYTKHLHIQYYHINGNIEGEYIQYNPYEHEKIQISQYYVNNKKHGSGLYMNVNLLCKYFSKKYTMLNFDINSKNYTKLNYNIDKLSGMQQVYINDRLSNTLYFYNFDYYCN